MLMPLQTSGTKPPLFFVHGLNGLMSLGSSFARALGSNQPLYAIHANGIVGREPVLDDMRKIVPAYIEQILAARPTGPIRIGGLCTGCIIAMEVASKLRQEGRQIGPVILVDPPPVPMGYDKRVSTVDPRDPKIAERLYQQVHGMLLDHTSRADNDAPFDARDPKQLHVATLAGVGVLVALARHIPTPFAGPAELIVCGERASGFFHPQMPWHRLLPGPRVVHVLPWGHRQLFQAGREGLCSLLKFMLDEAPMLEIRTECPRNFATDVDDAPSPRGLTERPVV